MLTFLSWPHDLHSLLLVRKSLGPVSERVLYRNISDLPASRAMSESLMGLVVARECLCDAVRARQEPFAVLLLDYIEDRARFALELLIARLLGRLLACRVCTLSARRYLPPKTDTAPSSGYSPGRLHSGCAHLRLPSGTFVSSRF